MLNLRISTIAFTGLITAVAAWSIWNGEMFPAEKDPSGGMSFFPTTSLCFLLRVVPLCVTREGRRVVKHQRREKGADEVCWGILQTRVRGLMRSCGDG